MKTPFLPGSAAFRVMAAWLFVFALNVQVFAQAPAAGGAEADKAWGEVEKATRPPMPPAEWQGKRPTEEQLATFRSQQGVLAGQAAGDDGFEFVGCHGDGCSQPRIL